MWRKCSTRLRMRVATPGPRSRVSGWIDVQPSASCVALVTGSSIPSSSTPRFIPPSRTANR